MVFNYLINEIERSTLNYFIVYGNNLALSKLIHSDVTAMC